MRVCMFAMMLPAHATGGMEIHAWDLAKGVAAKGHDVVVITTRHPAGIKKELKDGVEIHYVDEEATSKRPMGGKALEKLEELHKVKPFDVVHSQSFSAFYYVKGGLKKKLGIPLVTTLHGTAKTEIGSNLRQGLTPMLVPKIAFHTFNHHFRTKEQIRESEAVIAISRELTQLIPREFGISPKRVKTVYNGVDTEEFKPGKSGIGRRFPGKKILFTASVLHRQKGIQYLIKAMANVDDAILLIGGDGPYRKDLERLATRLGLSERVFFEGRIPHERLGEYINAADIFVIPTIRVEGLPLIELESMACGKPVIASDIGGIPTVIKDGKNGLLTKPGDAVELGEKIGVLLADNGLASRLGANARKTVNDTFSMKGMVDGTIEVFKEAMR